MAMAARRLETVVEHLASRPGHETVRTLLAEMCVNALDIPQGDVEFEIRIPEVRGRIDGLFGSTVFEFKRDLRRESDDAEEQLTRYLTERERSTGRRYLGVATDGADFVAYQIADSGLQKLDRFALSADDPRALLRWLDRSVTVRGDIIPSAETIREEFGRGSIAFNRALGELRTLWDAAKNIPEVDLKMALWSRHLEFVYGTLLSPEELFLQHTYLTIIAKAMAVQVLTGKSAAATDLLSGSSFASVGLHGAIETDFFDWPLKISGGDRLVDRIANQVGRFRLEETNTDLLKTIYESLIDPEQRHYLGEYYTPDWLAQWMCDDVINDPLRERVFDPSCGSGTFLFHAVRKHLEAAEARGLAVQAALESCTENVIGLDVHPVAVLFARVTYLLAIGTERLRQRHDDLFVPVYLGDAMQWDVRGLLSEEEVEIAVPGDRPLVFPGKVAEDPQLLESILVQMRDYSERNVCKEDFVNWLNRRHNDLPETDQSVVSDSYDHLRALHQAGRNHIWTYIIRNLTRPLWISMTGRRPSTIIGNPPWLKYNAMGGDMQRRFKTACQSRNIWVGGRQATHQDLSAYFFVRCTERYLDTGGKIAFVMPMAALSRGQFEKFRTGSFIGKGNIENVRVEFSKAWKFDSSVKPLFPVPSCVLFATRVADPGKPLSSITAYSGELPLRDSHLIDARKHLTVVPGVESKTVFTGHAHYKKKFKQGATITPRKFFFVEEEETGKFGSNRRAPLVRSRDSNLDKKPWKDLQGLSGNIESEFLHQVALGTSLAQFRLLTTHLCILPIEPDGSKLLDSSAAMSRGFSHVSRWLMEAERLWDTKGSGRLTLAGQLDYFGKLTAQYPLASNRVAYTKAGVRPVAAVISDPRVVIDHKLYWAEVSSKEEAQYLSGILNSALLHKRVEHLQAEGQFGKRDLDKLMVSLDIPKFYASNKAQAKIVEIVARAEKVAASVSIDEPERFQAARKKISKALANAAVLTELDRAISDLMPQ